MVFENNLLPASAIADSYRLWIITAKYRRIHSIFPKLAQARYGGIYSGAFNNGISNRS
ncbi:MAG: hypothetical protein QNJ46_33650 [Leptolyngbyaceae cyanobacterium MO_188.B28]|nr:hypothetical protein [Leptolyngbyaceae cyanobacterium MO_188.B28]